LSDELSAPQRSLSAESDVFVGVRRRLRRYLVCSMQGHFPVLIRTGDSALAIVFRTGAPHVGISGTLAVSTSADGGRSWSDPVKVQPRWDDNRNPAFGVNARGNLVLAYWKARLHAYQDDSGSGLLYAGSSNGDIGRVPALCIAHSTDNGRSWGEPQCCLSEHLSLASPYGRITRGHDVLFLPVYGRPREDMGCRDASYLLRSTDGGTTWDHETLVATGHNETSIAWLPDGRLLAAARSESGHVATCFSDNGGESFSQPVQVTRDGEHPADLTVLQSGRVLLTFGRRIRPYGCGALMSSDGGATWSRDKEILLAGDGAESTDLGYPSTVQLADGHLVTALYYASGSQMSEDWRGWGRVSCQAIHYVERDIS